MKIGFENAPVSHAGAHSQDLANLLGRYAPEHEFIVDAHRLRELDIYHGFGPGVPLSIWWRGVPTVVTVRDLNFLRHPGMYSLAQRLFALRFYRRACRTADRLIALNRDSREELSERLGIAPERIEVVMPLVAPAPVESPPKEALEAVRRKYELPEKFVLMLGAVEPRHHHEAVFEALLQRAADVGVVVCGRRTVWSDFLLGYARARHMATRVEFLYEVSRADLPALFALARAFVYLPDAALEASVVPIVEALRAGIPMVLSDTPLHREAAADGALYVDPKALDEVADALADVLRDDDLRSEISERARRRAELFSEYAVAQRLIDIYSSL